MRLIYFLPQLYNKGGLERTLTDKAEYMASKGHQVMFVTIEHHGSLAYELPEGVRHEDLSCHVYSLYSQPFYRRVSGFMHLKRLFRSRMKSVLGNFRPDAIVITIPYTENFVCDLMRVAKGIPVVVETHLAYGPHYHGEGKLENLMQYFYNPFRALRKVQLFITLTQGDAKSWQRLGMPNIKVIPNPLPACFNDADRHPKTKEQGRIICVGRLDVQKRYDRLVAAFALIADKHPAWHIDIFGEGKCRDAIQQQINAEGLQDRIKLRGTTSNIIDEYQRSQFFVLSSDYEGFGLVIIEAMACGLPVVGTDCPFGPSEIIEDGKTGLLAKMDVRDLADKMEWMMTHNDERHQMGLRAYTTAARYRLDTVMPRWVEAYQHATTVKVS
jgi:glycosyltransferase involved in cell wall biosynthesis